MLVTLDTTRPGAPTGVAATSKALGEIRVSWQSAPGPVPAGYNLYRQNASFVSTGAAVKVNSAPLTAGTYTDLSEEPTVEELTEKTQEFLSALEVTGPIEMDPVDYRGRSRIELSVESRNYTEEQTVEVSGVRLTLPDGMEKSILARYPLAGGGEKPPSVGSQQPHYC